MEEAEALHVATGALARLDERLRTDPFADALAAWTVTQEVIGAVALEGLAVREADLLCLLAEGHVFDKGGRTAVDVHAALDQAYARRLSAPTADTIAESFKQSVKMNVTRVGDAVEGAIDIDATFTADEISRVTSPDPWTSAGQIRQTMASSRFRGRGRRAGILVAPWLACSGFGLTRSAPLTAAPLAAIAGDVGLAEMLADEAEWPTTYFRALASGARRSYEAAASFARISKETAGLLGPKRASSRVSEGVRTFMARPIQSVGTLAATLGVTPTGGAHLLEQMVAVGIVAPYVPANNAKSSSRLYVMKKALGL